MHSSAALPWEADDLVFAHHREMRQMQKTRDGMELARLNQHLACMSDDDVPPEFKEVG